MVQVMSLARPTCGLADSDPVIVARAVKTILRRRDLSAAHVPGARVFYDGEHGLRVIAVGDTIWGEVWASGPRSRRATIHSCLHPDPVDLEFRFEHDGYAADSEDSTTEELEGSLYILGADWPRPRQHAPDLRRAVDCLFAVDYEAN